jgi:cytochrome c2
MTRTDLACAAALAAALTLACAAPQAVVGEGEVARGQEVFATYCTDGCHQTPRPDSLTASQWRVVARTMQTRLQEQGLAPISPGEYEALLAYLTAHARR